MKSLNRILLALVAATGVLATGTALGGSNTGTLAVSATVNTNCAVSTPGLTFTAIDPTAAVNSTGSATLTVKCTKGTTLTDIKLGPGGHQIAGGKRQLNNGSNNIAYQLFTDAGFTTLWGDSTTTGIGAKDNIGFTFTSVNAPQTYTVYGQILVADEDVPAATYTDSVTITLDF